MTPKLVFFCLIKRILFIDPENFIPANSISTPIHIQPEWYFLFAYAILRSIPNKLGGVIALVMSIIILLSLPLLIKNRIQSNKFYPLNKIFVWLFFINIFLLTWIGIIPVEYPYVSIGVYLTIFHFIFFIFNPLLTKIWDLINLQNINF